MYPGSKPLFFAPTQHEKVAGFKLPANPRHWQAEIIRYLKSQHPYLPLDNNEIDIRQMDVAKGAAVGSVILDRKLAIPVIIQRPRPGADPELAPMDVFFHEGQYKFLDPEAIKQLTHNPQIGAPEGGKKSKAVGGNPYIGDVTGDATPLEYSGQASPFAGPFDGSKLSYDVSVELLPEWMLKEAESLREQMKDKATAFGITGAVGGGLRGVIQGAKSGGNAKRRALNALARGAKDSLYFGATGAAAGGTLPAAKKVLGLTKKEQKQEAQKIKTVLRRELKKESSAEDFTVGLKTVVENGHLAHLSKLAYLDPNDIANFRQMLAANPHILQGSANNLQLVEMVARRGPDTPMARGSVVKNPNIMQVYAKPDGRVYVKFSGGPETRASQSELKTALGDRYTEVMSKLKAGSVFMEHDGVQQVSWDVSRPAPEAKPVIGDGLYAVRTRNGESVTGMVATTIMDFDGKTLPMKLFVAPAGQYAIAGELFGVKLSSKHRMPAQAPTAGQTGVFVNYVHGTPISTLPLRITGVRTVKPQEGDARVVYMVQNPVTGERFALCPTRNVQGFERMRVVAPGVQALSESADVYMIPGDSEWISLKNRIDVVESSDQLTKLSAFHPDEGLTKVAYAAGLWHIDAWVDHKSFISNETVRKQAALHDMSEPDARETLVAMGMPVDDVVPFMDQVRSRSGMDKAIKVAGLHEPQIQGFDVIELPKPVYDDATIAFVESLRPGVELVKAAAESGHPETLDTILSLEFITPQNLRYFVDNIPDLEETCTRLAALLISVRLGMPHVPEQPVKDALQGLSTTVNKLKLMKSAIDHKAERTASSS